MAETFKEFGNQTYTSSDITNNDEIVIFTNNASTKAIVRDVEVQNNDFEADEAKFYVGGTVVGDTFEDSTGTVFVDENQSFYVKLNTALTAPSLISTPMQQLNNSTTADPLLTPVTKNSVSSPYSYPTTGISTATTVGSAVDINPPVGGLNPNNGYRYDVFPTSDGSGAWWYTYLNVSGDALFTRYNSDGSTTNADTNGYRGNVFDYSSKKFIQNNGGTIRELDLTSNSISFTNWSSSFLTSGSTYAIGAAAGGYYFYTHSGQGLYMTNATRSQSAYINNSSFANSSYPALQVVYNEDEERFYIISGYGTSWSAGTQNVTFTKANLDATNGNFSNYTSLGNSPYAALGLTANPSINGNTPYLWGALGTAGKYFTVAESATTTGLYECSGGSITRVEGVSLTNIAGTVGSMTYLRGDGPATSTTQNVSNYVINNRIRTVGVEIT